MSLETLRPDAELSDVGLVASVVTDHDADPDTDSSVTDATGNGVSTEYGVDFPTPTGNPTGGADLQEFRAGVFEVLPILRVVEIAHRVAFGIARAELDAVAITALADRGLGHDIGRTPRPPREPITRISPPRRA